MRDEDVVAFGFRDEAQARSFGSPAIPRTIRGFNVERVRKLGIRAAAREALQRLKNAPEGFWIHFDVDVPDNDSMPAADNDVPGGLSFGEVEETLRAMTFSGRAAGMNVTIFNPTIDPDGSLAQKIVDSIVGGVQGIR